MHSCWPFLAVFVFTISTPPPGLIGLADSRENFCCVLGRLCVSGDVYGANVRDVFVLSVAQIGRVIAARGFTLGPCRLRRWRVVLMPLDTIKTIMQVRRTVCFVLFCLVWFGWLVG